MMRIVHCGPSKDLRQTLAYRVPRKVIRALTVQIAQ
jgi:hypothetical protein